MRAVLCLVVFIYFLNVSVQEADGLKCYSCNSLSQIACKYTFYSLLDGTEECVGAPNDALLPKCYVISAENKDGIQHVARGCLATEAKIDCESIASSIGWVSETGDDLDSLKTLSCGVCEENVCNSAQRFEGVVFVALILAAAAFMF